ncbi:MAG: hypothetical protein ACNYPE_13160 [Candidatus Azotimanducaceae bacterium WSBS_2022_MAG_OTU7]
MTKVTQAHGVHIACIRVVRSMGEHIVDLGQGLLKLLAGDQFLDFGKVDLRLLNGISPEDFSLQHYMNSRR